MIGPCIDWLMSPMWLVWHMANTHHQYCSLNPLIDRSQSAGNCDVIAALTTLPTLAIVMVMLIADHRHQVIIIIA